MGAQMVIAPTSQSLFYTPGRGVEGKGWYREELLGTYLFVFFLLLLLWDCTSTYFIEVLRTECPSIVVRTYSLEVLGQDSNPGLPDSSQTC
jgi:hypothetical protein